MSDFFVWLIFFYRNKKSLRCKGNAPVRYISCGEHRKYGIGRIVHPRLQPFQLAHIDSVAAPHEENNEE